MPFKDRAFHRHLALGANPALVGFDLDEAVQHLEIFKPHGRLPRVGRTIRRNRSCVIRPSQAEFFAAINSSMRAHRFFQDEILIRGRLTVVDLLGPLLQRQLDPKSLVDRKGDIQKIEAVDFQIVDGMAFRRDRVAGNVARLGNDIGDFIESGGHLCSQRSRAGGCQPREGDGQSLPFLGLKPYSERGAQVQRRRVIRGFLCPSLVQRSPIS